MPNYTKKTPRTDKVLQEAKSATAHGGQLELFFDDTQVEVEGRKVQGTAFNYESKLACSWQTLWAGPFLLDAEWGPVREAIGRKGQPIIEQYGWIRHRPGQECKRAKTFAVVAPVPGRILSQT